MAKKSVAPIVPIKILKIGTCTTLSGRSELTFHIGCNVDSEVHVRVVQNSGNGQFNADWVALSLIEKLLNEHPADKSMTSRVMQAVFRSKSSNSPAFLFAALKAEGLVKAGVEKDSGYLIGDIVSFKKAMTVLIDQGIDLSTPADTPSVPTKKRTATGGK